MFYLIGRIISGAYAGTGREKIGKGFPIFMTILAAFCTVMLIVSIIMGWNALAGGMCAGMFFGWLGTGVAWLSYGIENY